MKESENPNLIITSEQEKLSSLLIPKCKMQKEKKWGNENEK